MVEILIFILLGTLSLGFDRQIANAMSQISCEFGEFCGERRVWGTLSKPPDPQMSYQNFLFFTRFWGSVVALLGISLFLLTS
jgi:hypothetical protein